MHNEKENLLWKEAGHDRRIVYWVPILTTDLLYATQWPFLAWTIFAQVTGAVGNGNIIPKAIHFGYEE